MCAGAQGSAVELQSEESLSGMCVESKGGNYANLAVLYSPVCSREGFFTECKAAFLVADTEFSKLPLSFYPRSVL